MHQGLREAYEPFPNDKDTENTLTLKLHKLFAIHYQKQHVD